MFSDVSAVVYYQACTGNQLLYICMNQSFATTPERAEQQVHQLLQEGKLQEAASACDHLTETFPAYGPGWCTASELAMSLKHPDVALRAIDRALRIAPQKPEWLLQKMACLTVSGNLASARETAAELDGHEFDTAYHASTCGRTLNRLELFDDAVRHYRSAVRIEPDNGTNHFNLGSALRHLGRLEEAGDSFDRAIELNPDDYQAYKVRSELRTQSAEANHVDELRSALEKAPEDHPGRVQLCYALAKELEDMEEFEASFSYLQSGASAYRRGIKYDQGRFIEPLNRFREVYKAKVFDAPDPGYINADPIFIIGMPRSGGSLVDKVLSSHSVVKSAGRIHTFGKEIFNQCMRVFSSVPEDPAELVALTRKINYAALGETYVASARRAAEASAHFVDMLPINFAYAGLIHLALPKAKIVWLKRDPMDTCYDVYRTLFQGAYPYSYDLIEIANYYAAYQELMAHWQTVMPDVFHIVRYEEFVTEPRPAVELLLEYCHLSWEDACIHFDVGAAEGRNGKSIGMWRNYEKQLQPIADILGTT